MTALRSPSPFALAEARKVFASLNIKDPEDLEIELVAARMRALVEVRDLADCDGRLLRGRDCALIVVDRRSYQTKKWRFTVAHELGHLRLHKDLDQFKRCTEHDLTDYRQSGRETEANDFAAELLMPKSMFGPLCDAKRPTMSQIRKLAERFATSLTATAIRFVECSPEPCAVVFAEAGRIKWWMRNDGFTLWLSRGERLSFDTYAYDLAQGKSVDDRMQLTDGRAWCDDRRADGVDLHEHPVSLPAIGAVLTLLWHPVR